MTLIPDKVKIVFTKQKQAESTLYLGRDYDILLNMLVDNNAELQKICQKNRRVGQQKI